MEPVSAIALSLALGAGAVAGTEVVKAVVKDGYDKVKALVKSRYPGVSVEALEQVPDSKPRRDVVEEDLRKSGAAGDAELAGAAQKLIELIRTRAPGAATAIGVDLKDVEAANVRLRDIAASGTGATGVRMETVRVRGDIDISNVNVRAGTTRDDPVKGG